MIDIDKNKTYWATLETTNFDEYSVIFRIEEAEDENNDPVLVEKISVRISSEEYDGIVSGKYQWGQFLPEPYNCVMGDDDGGFWVKNNKKTMIKITCKHPQSIHGLPVILDGAEVMDYNDGVKRACKILGITQRKLAEMCGYKYYTALTKQTQAGKPAAKVLNVLAVELSDYYIKTGQKVSKTN